MSLYDKEKMSLYDKEKMLESSIVGEIVKNKDRLRFIEKFKSSEWSSTYSYKYRFYLKQKNLFGFRKYITIILEEDYFNSITIIVPAFIADIGFDEEVKITNYDNRHILKKILEDCYEDRSKYIILKNLCEIIKK